MPSTTRIAVWLLIILAQAVVVTRGIAPPDPTFAVDFYEQVRAYRTAHNSSYVPRHLAPGHCWFLSDEICRHDDEALARAKVETNRGEGRRGLVRTGDKIKVLVLLVRFKDHAKRDLPAKSYYDDLFNGKSGTETNPVGNIADYFFDLSLGKYKVTFDVQDWQTTDNTEAFYANGEFGLRGAEASQELFKPVLTRLYSSGYDFKPLDSDQWGDLDHLVVLHSGYNAESGVDDCTGNTPENRIWSQGTASTVNGWRSPDSAYSVSTYMIGSGMTGGLCKGIPQKHGLIVHEYTHGFGAIDLYDQDRDEPSIKLGGIAKFCMMSNLFGWKRNERIPGMMNAFTRVLIGWLEPIYISQDGYYPIQPCEISSQIYVIKKNFPSGEYIYIENRQPYRWDSDWDASGIAMYKIDDNADQQFTRGYPGHPNWPAEHLRVSVLQADGKYDLEQGNNVGEQGDFWSFGQKLSPGGSFPNSDGISFGKRVKTGIEIEVVSDSKFVILLRISGLS